MNSKWSQQEVTLLFPDEEKEEHMCEWQTDLVIPFGDSHRLLWVDLLRGILLSPNLFEPDCPNELEYVRLPPGLLSARVEGDWTVRPQEFRNLSCINSELKLVDLRVTNHNSVEVTIWALQLQADNKQTWTKEFTNNLKASPVPSFPVLSTDKSDILYLTEVKEEEARLLQYDTKTWTLKDSKGYPPRFFNHRRPPYPSELAKYLHNFSTTELFPTPANYQSIYDTISQQSNNNAVGDCAPVDDYRLQTCLSPSRASSSQHSDRAVPKFLQRDSQTIALQPCNVNQISSNTPHDLSSRRTLVKGLGNLPGLGSISTRSISSFWDQDRCLDAASSPTTPTKQDLTSKNRFLQMGHERFAQTNIPGHRTFDILQHPLAGHLLALDLPQALPKNTVHGSQFPVPYHNELQGSSLLFTGASGTQKFQLDQWWSLGILLGMFISRWTGRNSSRE